MYANPSISRGYDNTCDAGRGPQVLAAICGGGRRHAPRGPIEPSWATVRREPFRGLGAMHRPNSPSQAVAKMEVSTLGQLGDDTSPSPVARMPLIKGFGLSWGSIEGNFLGGEPKTELVVGCSEHQDDETEAPFKGRHCIESAWLASLWQKVHGSTKAERFSPPIPSNQAPEKRP